MAWFQTVSDAVYNALCAVFQVNPDAQSSMNRFIPAYVEGTSTPQEDRDVDVCYYAVSEERGTAYDYVMLTEDEGKIEIKATVPVNVLLIFYGPHADDDAEKFWKVIQVDNGYKSARAILRKSNITLNGKPGRPVSVPEVEGTLWRRRCDVPLSLSYLDTEVLEAGMVERPPDINITLAD